MTRKYAGQKPLEKKGRCLTLSREFSILLDAIPDRLLLLSPRLKVQWANKAASEQLGGEASKLTGEHCYRLWHRRSAPCDECHAIQSFRTGEVSGSQHRTPDGKWWDSRAFPVKEVSGKVRSIITVARDVTEKIRMEEESKTIRTKLIHANKMASLGTLISGVAHEINNPNNVIMLNSQLISDAWTDAIGALKGSERENALFGGLPYSEMKETAPALISGIRESATIIKNIIDDLRDYSRNDTSRLDKPVDVNRVISTSVSILKNDIRKNTNRFDCLLEPNLPSIKGSPQQLEQVIINLVTNSLQALSDKKHGVEITSARDGSHIIVRVKDEGMGMSSEVLGKIGEPFFTTKLDKGGTGLGLSICNAIIRDHKGSIEIESVPEEGTVATIRLPIPDFAERF